MGKGEEPRKKSSFKKFSELKSTGKSPKDAKEDPSNEILPVTDDKLPGNPNLPKGSTKFPKDADTSYLQPVPEQEQDETDGEGMSDEPETTNEKVKFYGKVAKFPKKTKASKAYNFLENVKISKNSIWYIMVEKDNELQMVKYNYKKGVDLAKFVAELKTYYISKNKSNKIICEAISKISIDGNDKFSMIRNIPLIEVDGRKLITLVTTDLIKLLSK